MKKFLITILFAVSFWFGSHALAADILDIQQTTVSNYLYWSSFENFGQQFVADQNNISKIYVYYHLGTSTVAICKGVPADSSPGDLAANGATCNYAGNTLIHSEQISDEGTPGTYKFASPVSLEIGQNYWFYFGSNTYSAINAGYYTSGGGLVIGGEPNVASLSFQTYYSDTYVPPPTYSITLTSPLSSQSYISPVSTVNFLGTYTNPGATFNFINFGIEDMNTGSVYSKFYQVAYTTSGNFSFNVDLPDGTYGWMGIYWLASSTNPGHIFASSTTEYFAVAQDLLHGATSTSALYYANLPSYSTACTPAEWATPDPVFDFGFATTSVGFLNMTVDKCILIEGTLTLFKKISDMANFSGQVFITTISNVFPFNVALNIKDSWNASATGTLPSDLSYFNIADGSGNIHMTIPAVWTGGASSTPVVFGAGIFTANGSALSDFFAGIKALSTYLMWMLFIFEFYKFAGAVYLELQ